MRLEYAPSDKERVIIAQTKTEMAELFRPYVCNLCLEDAGLLDYHGSLEVLLATPCGCEWWLTDDNGEHIYCDEWI